ncbi:MAG: Gfo/Idh/MocA family oxidoreductase [Planctomycetia bacterium]|nr:Gfo/Idh/MocA family oxidoreductase [Planctomycetia bacterium]
MKRRDFLKVGGLGVASWMISSNVGYSGFEERFADKKYRVGVIGPGWYGKVDVLRLIQVAPVEVVSICDVDQPTLQGAAEIIASRQISQKEPRRYTDYRKMLAEKDLDIVLVASPDHWHALHMLAAIESGADVYVQKPISVDVVESQAMLAAARRLNRVVQVGLQRRSTPHLIDAKEQIIESGKLGKVGQVEIYTYYGGGPLIQEATNPPEGFDYEMWTGPAPMRPYYPVVRYRGWRNFMEYGNGTVGDMCVHMFDMTRWFLNLGWPKRISSHGGIQIKKKGISNIADTQTIIFDYEDLQVIWNHRNWSEVTDPRHHWGAYLYGEHGTLKSSVYGYDFKPYHSNDIISADVQYELKEYPEDENEKDLERHCAPAVRNHMKNFLDRISDRGRPVSDIEEGAISTICCILGNLSMKLKRTVEWDVETQTVKNDPEAEALFQRVYRSPWVHPQV